MILQPNMKKKMLVNHLSKLFSNFKLYFCNNQRLMSYVHDFSHLSHDQVQPWESEQLGY